MLTRLIAPMVLLTALMLMLAPTIARADDAGAKQLVTAPIAAAPDYAKYALVIGADDYLYASPLTDCGQDAHAFADLLKSKFGFQTVIVMTDDAPDPRFRPTRVNIKKALNALYDAVQPSVSQIVFFYSGHGARTTDAAGDTDWLVPEDVDVTDPEGDFISYSAIRSKLDTLGPARALLITDACRNLFGGKGVGDGGKGFGAAGQPAGREIAELFSCEPTQVSQEGDPKEFSESVFTHFLIQGLSGAPDAADASGIVTFDSLERYVRGQVSGYVSQHFNTEQDPDGLATSGEMVLAKLVPAHPSLTPEQQKTADAQFVALWTDSQGNLSGDKAGTLSLDAVQQALGAGADVNARDASGETALMWAAVNDRMDIVGALLKAGADVNAKDTYGWNALIHASQTGQTDIVQALMAAGTDVNVKDGIGNFALNEAALNDHTETVKALLADKANINASNNDGGTALIWAAGSGHTDTVKILLDGGEDFDAKDNNGETALMEAARNGKTDIVNMLLAAGADKQAANKDGTTALMKAADGGWGGATVQPLLDAGADVNARDNAGRTALWHAENSSGISADAKAATIALLKAAGATE